jgi:hypothetical protein
VDSRTEMPRRVAPDAMVARDGSFIYYPIPKNASRSLVKALAEKAMPANTLSGDLHPRMWLETQPRPAFSFTFLRNPAARVVSAWRNKVRSPYATPGQARLMERSVGLRKGMALEEFVDWLADTFDHGGNIDQHWLPQANYVCSIDGPLCVDWLGTVEGIRKDFAEISPRLGLPSRLPHKSKTLHWPWERLSRRSRATVERLYAQDFELFEAARSRPRTTSSFRPEWLHRQLFRGNR